MDKSILPYPYKTGALMLVGLSCFVVGSPSVNPWTDCRDASVGIGITGFSWAPFSCSMLSCMRTGSYDPYNPPEIDMTGIAYLKTGMLFSLVTELEFNPQILHFYQSLITTCSYFQCPSFTDYIFIKATSIGLKLMRLGVTNSHVEYDIPYILLGALPITGFWVHYSSSEILE